MATNKINLRTASVLLAVLAALLVSACTVGPDYRAPTAQVPAGYSDAGADANLGTVEVDLAHQPALELEASELAWWRSFDDPLLVELVERAVGGNLRIEQALARLDEARAVRRARSGRLVPNVGASASGGRQRASAAGPGPLAGLAEAGLAELENELYTAGFDVGWEVDLFGGVRRGIEASQARLEATEESLRGTLLLIAAEVAAAYVDLRGAELRLDIAERNLAIQQDTLEVIEGKVDTGLLPPIDVERTRTERASLRAALPPLRATRAAAVHRLGVLTGHAPAALGDLLAAAGGGVDGSGAVAALPEPPELIVAGQPSGLLLRRPDLRAAERELQASTADVGGALADRYPSITLGGSWGFEAESLGDLLESGSRAWTIGPRIEVPVFQGGRLEAQVEAARARLRGAEASWQQAVLRALEEVENGLVGYREARLARESWAEAAASSRRTSELAGVLYELGLRDHLVLLDAQRSQTAIEDALALSRIEVARSAVRLYLALGGGWTELEGRLGQRAGVTAGEAGEEPSVVESER